MKPNKILVLFLVSIGSVILSFQANASCAFFNPDYSSRDNNRYSEGVLSRLKINSDFKLVSFVTFNTTESLGETLTVKVPKIYNNQPDLLIREFEKEYLLDNITLFPEINNFYNFSWSNCVIKKSHIALDKLRFIATSSKESQTILLPVIFGEPGKQYNFVFRTPKPTIIKSFEIKKENKIVYNTSSSSQIGEILLTWDGRNNSNKLTEPGLYNLLLEVEIRDISGLIETYTKQISFYHDPNWLRQ